MSTPASAAAPTTAASRPSAAGLIAAVTRAELRKFLARGGIRTSTILAVLIGNAAGLAFVLATLDETAKATLQLSVAGAISLGPAVALFVLGIGVAAYVPREISDGTILTAKMLVPQSRELFLGRLSAWFTIAVAVAASCLVPSLVLALLIPQIQRTSVGVILASVLVSLVVPALTVCLIHAGALVLKRGAYIVAAALTLLLILPLALTLVQMMLPGTWADISRALDQVLIGRLVVTAMAVPEDGSHTWSAMVTSNLGVLAWLGFVGLIAYRQFCAEGFGDE